MGRSSIPAALSVVATGLLLFMVGCGSGEQAQGGVGSPESQAAIRRYRAYLESGATDLVTRAKTLVGQIEAGELPEAQSTYSADRVPYGHIKPVARSFGNLDSRIDSLPGEVPASELSGFHLIEKGLFAEETTAGLTPAAKQLLANLEKVQGRLKTVRLRPAEFIKNSTAVLGELSASAIHNKEERYSQLDMVDVSADVEGIEAAFSATKPALAEADPELAANIETKLNRAYARVRHFGTPANRPHQFQPEAPGTSFVLYYVRTPAEFHVMNQKIEALATQLSQAPARLEGN